MALAQLSLQEATGGGEPVLFAFTPSTETEWIRADLTTVRDGQVISRTVGSDLTTAKILLPEPRAGATAGTPSPGATPGTPGATPSTDDSTDVVGEAPDTRNRMPGAIAIPADVLAPEFLAERIETTCPLDDDWYVRVQSTTGPRATMTVSCTEDRRAWLGDVEMGPLQRGPELAAQAKGIADAVIAVVNGSKPVRYVALASSGRWTTVKFQGAESAGAGTQGRPCFPAASYQTTSTEHLAYKLVESCADDTLKRGPFDPSVLDWEGALTAVSSLVDPNELYQDWEVTAVLTTRNTVMWNVSYRGQGTWFHLDGKPFEG